MKLYHVGTKIIEKPDLKFGRKNVDFGQGFYLSPDIDFSLKWATNGMILNVYELDLSNLKIKEFDKLEPHTR